jgi:hypothetical protein
MRSTYWPIWIALSVLRKLRFRNSGNLSGDSGALAAEYVIMVTLGKTRSSITKVWPGCPEYSHGGAKLLNFAPDAKHEHSSCGMSRV